MLSSSFYILYWFYLTWKQLKEATGNPHRPVWHALALLVPIYAWFVVYGHLKTIKGLQDKAEIKPSLNIGGLLAIYVIANVLAFQTIMYEGTAVLILDIISVILMTVFLVVAQNNLNRYWEHVKGSQLSEARVGIGEVVFVILGLFYWWATYLVV